MGIISYAQNFEDVMLWRALGHIEKGFYIDLGAQDPIIDSVSFAFYERDWHGINVEPTQQYAARLREQRPRDTVIQAAVGKEATVLRFFEIPNTGISTADSLIADQHRARGYDVQEIYVPCIPLSVILEAIPKQDIHWLKIDVEGYEDQVLSSLAASSNLPWIIVVESTIPLTQIETNQCWEFFITSLGFLPVYFDGLNRYYVSPSHPELIKSFNTPPNVFDNFTLSGKSSSTFHRFNTEFNQEEVVAISEECKRDNQSDAEKLLQQRIALLELNHSVREHLLLKQLHAEQKQFACQSEKGIRDKEDFSKKLHVAREVIHRLQLDMVKCKQTFSAQLLDMARKNIQSRVEHEIKFNLQLGQLRADHNQQSEKMQQQFFRQEAYFCERESAIVRQAAKKTRRLKRIYSEYKYTINQKLKSLQEEKNKLMLECLQLDEKLRHKKDHIAILRQSTESVSAQLAQASGAALKLRGTINDLESELENITNSASWRMTAPLRWIANCGRSILKRTVRRNGETHGKVELIPDVDGFQDKSSDLNDIKETGMMVTLTTENNSQSPTFELNQLLALNDHDFIGAVYKLLLNRIPDEQGFRYYTNRLRCGHTKIQVLADIRLSPEGKKQLSKNPIIDAAIKKRIRHNKLFIGGALYWLKSIFRIFVVAKQCATSHQFGSELSSILYQYDESFVASAYKLCLGRSPDPAGFDYYLVRLRAGISKLHLISEIRRSPESAAYAKHIPEIDAILVCFKISRFFLIGPVFRILCNIEGESPIDRKIRRIDNMLSANLLKTNYEASHKSTLFMADAIDMESKSSNIDGTPAGSDSTFFCNSSPRAGEIYRKLITADALFKKGLA